MSKTLALVTIHGMGDTPPDYDAAFHEHLRKELGKDVWERIATVTLYYQGLLQVNQRSILARMQNQIDWQDLRRFLMYGISDAASLEFKRESPGSPYFQTQTMIRDQLAALFDAVGRQPVPVLLVAHSLGCQVISSYVWDAQQKRPSSGVWKDAPRDCETRRSPRDRFLRLRTLRRLFTTGCNIPIFVAGHEKIKAIKPPHPEFRWINMFDKDDVLGWPLRPLSPSYHQLVEDVPVNAGGGLLGTLLKSWNPLCHDQYWDDNEVIRPIAGAIRELS